MRRRWTRARRIPRNGAIGAISSIRNEARNEEALRVLRANLERIGCNGELVAAGTLDIMRALTEIAERDAEEWPCEEAGAKVGLQVCGGIVRVDSARCAFKALAYTHAPLAIYKALDAYVKAQM